MYISSVHASNYIAKYTILKSLVIHIKLKIEKILVYDRSLLTMSGKNDFCNKSCGNN